MKTVEDSVLVLRVGEDGVRLIDLACGACSACSEGARIRCEHPVAEGRTVSVPLPAQAADVIEASLHAAKAVLEISGPQAEPILALGRGAGLVAALLETNGYAGVVVAADHHDPEARRRLRGAHTSGRARIVVSPFGARAALKAVRRGGTVCTSPFAESLPSITEIVQREATVRTGGDPAALAAALHEREWNRVLSLVSE